MTREEAIEVLRDVETYMRRAAIPHTRVSEAVEALSTPSPAPLHESIVGVLEAVSDREFDYWGAGDPKFAKVPAAAFDRVMQAYLAWSHAGKPGLPLPVAKPEESSDECACPEGFMCRGSDQRCARCLKWPPVAKPEEREMQSVRADAAEAVSRFRARVVSIVKEELARNEGARDRAASAGRENVASHRQTDAETCARILLRITDLPSRAAAEPHHTIAGLLMAVSEWWLSDAAMPSLRMAARDWHAAGLPGLPRASARTISTSTPPAAEAEAKKVPPSAGGHERGGPTVCACGHSDVRHWGVDGTCKERGCRCDALDLRPPAPSAAEAEAGETSFHCARCDHTCGWKRARECPRTGARICDECLATEIAAAEVHAAPFAAAVRCTFTRVSADRDGGAGQCRYHQGHTGAHSFLPFAAPITPERFDAEARIADLVDALGIAIAALDERGMFTVREADGIAARLKSARGGR